MIPHRLLWTALAKERHHRKVRARTIVAFWCAFAFVVAFILGCWVMQEVLP